jgi:sulfoxide reductase heme-binding subunit YedZ
VRIVKEQSAPAFVSSRKPTLNWPLLATHLAGWIPALNIAWAAWQGRLSINPIQDLTFGTGLPALIFLVATLAVTPAITLTGWNWLAPIRRWLGLYSFFYATTHFLIFAVVDYGLDLALIGEAIVEKRYVLAGAAALLIMLPLALTSTRGWQKRLGRYWKFLHRAVYAAGLLAVLHFVWLVKADIREPLLYGAAVVGLLLLRVPAVRRRLSGWRRGWQARGRATPSPPKPVAED